MFFHQRCRFILSFHLRPALSYSLVYLNNKCGPDKRVLCSCWYCLLHRAIHCRRINRSLNIWIPSIVASVYNLCQPRIWRRILQQNTLSTRWLRTGVKFCRRRSRSGPKLFRRRCSGVAWPHSRKSSAMTILRCFRVHPALVWSGDASSTRFSFHLGTPT